jgi:hypothetical protein
MDCLEAQTFSLIAWVIVYKKYALCKTGVGIGFIALTLITQQAEYSQDKECAISST